MTTIKIAHSPDADDAFMFYALFQGKIDTGSLQFEEIREDIESLNQKAMEGVYDVSAISFHAYPYIAEKYFLLSTGACFGDRYGPIVISSKVLKPKQLLRVRMAIPGKLTSAFLALKLYEHHLAGEGKSGICYSQVAFDQIIDHVIAGKMDAGLLIHEGQLNFSDKGLHKIVDLGEWWYKETQLPLPLGGIVARRDLSPELIKEVGLKIRESVLYALEHKEEALAYALPFARGLDAEKAKEFVGMYVNDTTIDLDRKGIKAIKTLLEKGYQQGIVKKKVDLDEALFHLKRGGRINQPQSGVEGATQAPPMEEPTLTVPVEETN